MRKFVLVITLLALFAAGCEGGAGEAADADAEQVDRQQLVYQRNGQGVPFFDFSQDRETLRQIYVLRNEAVATHTIFTSNGTGQIVDDCPSIGYAIPADTQLTSPETGEYYHSGGVATLPQPEPNGLYSSQNTDGTWVICVRDGREVPVYSELKLTTYPYPIEVNADRLSVTKAGDAEASVKVGEQVDVGETVPADGGGGEQ